MCSFVALTAVIKKSCRVENRLVFAVASAIVLFLYGLQALTREIQTVGGDTLKKWLGRLKPTIQCRA